MGREKSFPAFFCRTLLLEELSQGRASPVEQRASVARREKGERR